MNTINHCLKQAVDRQKEKALFIQPSSGETLTFSGFAEAMGGVHRVLAQHRVGPGDVVTLIAANSIDLAVMLYGTMTFGAIAKPLNPQITPVELEKLLSHFEKIGLRNADVPADVLGDAYLYLITMFAEGAGNYWSTDIDQVTTARSYIPETAWNETPLGNGLSASGGGPSNYRRGSTPTRSW